MTILTCLGTSAYATVQRPDIVIQEGVVYRLPERGNTFPLEALWADTTSRPKLTEGPNGMMSTACWRGYIAIWEIEDGVLYLKGLDAWLGDKKADLKTLFPKRYKNGKVKADWFTGALNLSTSFGLVEDPSVTLKFEKGKQLPTKPSTATE
jgi:hypothetical protein